LIGGVLEYSRKMLTHPAWAGGAIRLLWVRRIQNSLLLLDTGAFKTTAATIASVCRKRFT
jgi:hypothetical protein